MAGMLVLGLAAATGTCPPAGFAPQAGFDLDAYIRTPWNIQQQALTKYIPVSHNRCVTASYTKAHNFLGYDLAVHNIAYDVAPPHAKHDSDKDSKVGLCAKVVDATNGKLEVAPCLLPTFLAGEYWVLHFDDALGFAVVSGGPPTLASNGACKNDPTKINGAGFWIFTRAQVRDEAVMGKARAAAAKLGLDLSVLNDVDQTDCPAEVAQDLHSLMLNGQPAEVVETAEEAACCEGACATAGEEKYWSIAKSMGGTPHCGECCMDPKKYPLYHFFEKNLTKSSSVSPCEGFGFTKYDSTVTHGFGPVKMTLDLYDKPAEVVEMVETAEEAACCEGACATAGEEKYWSIAKSMGGTPHCGECCMDPKKYPLYHFFEKNLTKSSSVSPCEGFGFTKYDSTVTHGFGPVKMTLDLYDEPAVLVV